jgi:hypothetical protein
MSSVKRKRGPAIAPQSSNLLVNDRVFGVLRPPAEAVMSVISLSSLFEGIRRA